MPRASVLKLSLSGCYPTAALEEHDLLETAVLLDLFTADETLVGAWRADPSDYRLRPVRVRMVLDDRDSFTERKTRAGLQPALRPCRTSKPKAFQMLSPAPAAILSADDGASRTLGMLPLQPLNVTGAKAFRSTSFLSALDLGRRERGEARRVST